MRIDHVAYVCRDPRKTHRFYTEVLRLPLAQVYAGHELMLVYSLPEGGSLVFSNRRDENLPAATAEIAWERAHVGLTVATRAEFDDWLDHLKQSGVPHQLIDDERIYFADPDGVVLELEVAAPSTVNDAAPEMLERWLAG